MSSIECVSVLLMLLCIRVDFMRSRHGVGLLGNVTIASVIPWFGMEMTAVSLILVGFGSNGCSVLRAVCVTVNL